MCSMSPVPAKLTRYNYLRGINNHALLSPRAHDLKIRLSGIDDANFPPAVSNVLSSLECSRNITYQRLQLKMARKIFGLYIFACWDLKPRATFDSNQLGLQDNINLLISAVKLSNNYKQASIEENERCYK